MPNSVTSNAIAAILLLGVVFIMEDLRKFKNVYHVEVIGDAGGWLDFVIADNADDAIRKVMDVYGQYHKNLQISIRDNYDYYIE